VYGKDVRQAIYDSIVECNNTANSSSTTATNANTTANNALKVANNAVDVVCNSETDSMLLAVLTESVDVTVTNNAIWQPGSGGLFSGTAEKSNYKAGKCVVDLSSGITEYLITMGQTQERHMHHMYIW
jgi:hypothetical protein